MKGTLFLIWLCAISFELTAQALEITGIQDTYKGTVGDVVRAPLRFTNHSDRPITVHLRRSGGQIGTSQRSYFCRGGDCFDGAVGDILIKLDPGQSVNDLEILLEAGLVPGLSTVRYTAVNRANPSEHFEFDLNFVIEERRRQSSIYNSRYITVQDVYPNPASDYAYVDYRLLEDQVSARIVVHSVLGNIMGEYELPSFESQAKILTGNLNAGIYFYTLYIDGEAVMTRKLIVKR
ncbi:MAG: T9SS type A sorting domain-containing protein [Cyclobacteriaceae bacterium]|nr:T9SS type A sorting domain-containing protein [Cyclobacteriaceae bacterium]